jgi:hypothetical protein
LLSNEEQSDLLALARHWDGKYTFRITEGTWAATPAAEPDSVLTAASAAALGELVRRDYASRQDAARNPVHLSERMST